jgi:hypothetical protein
VAPSNRNPAAWGADRASETFVAEHPEASRESPTIQDGEMRIGMRALADRVTSLGRPGKSAASDGGG